MNALVLPSQVTTRLNIMHESLSRLKYGPPYLAKALFKIGDANSSTQVQE